jgi:hypothetical protein
MSFECSANSGIIPLQWNQSNVTAIYKSAGSKSDPGNYRPISLTSIPCKVLESIIKQNMLLHVEKHELVKSTQHGFVGKRSCLSNLLTSVEYVTSHVDKGIPVDVLYLDFKKAFDKVPHCRLLHKVSALGISGKVLASNRVQRVVINHGYQWAVFQLGCGN